jgi:hypothetical protein
VHHLRRGFIATKVGHFRGSENPDKVKFADAVTPQVISVRRCLITTSKEDPDLNTVFGRRPKDARDFVLAQERPQEP